MCENINLGFFKLVKYNLNCPFELVIVPSFDPFKITETPSKGCLLE